MNKSYKDDLNSIAYKLDYLCSKAPENDSTADQYVVEIMDYVNKAVGYDSESDKLKTSKLIEILVHSLALYGDLPTNISDFGWYSYCEGGQPEKLILFKHNSSEEDKEGE